jgi:hypothetical protein
MSDQNKLPSSYEAALRRIEEKKQPQSLEVAQRREAALRIEKKEKEPEQRPRIWDILKLIALLIAIAAPGNNPPASIRHSRRRN